MIGDDVGDVFYASPVPQPNGDSKMDRIVMVTLGRRYAS